MDRQEVDKKVRKPMTMQTMQSNPLPELAEAVKVKLAGLGIAYLVNCTLSLVFTGKWHGYWKKNNS